MAFDATTRNKLARMVASARKLLTEEFTRQLQEIYGIQPDGSITELEKLTRLDDEERDIAGVLRERIRHLAAGLASEKKPMAAAVDRMTREQAFTVLNRFAALRMCEERKLVQECVRNGLQSKGFQVFLQTAGTSLGDHYHRYRVYLNCLFDEIAIDLGILFDRFSPFGLLFPRETALLELLQTINSEELKHIWAEDETIGWVYQYFNPPEERKKMREDSPAPRNSRELAVRNQFFTPRYVVEFLTDNTLGRIWYEMRKGETRLADECDYLVRRPTEIFLAPGDEPPEAPNINEDLSQEEMLSQPVFIAHRPRKDPRDLKILDPACGSGHFLLYAFELLLKIYEEGWEDDNPAAFEETGTTLRDDYGSLEGLRPAVPELILRHNLHGIDIDHRAVQIAALALWLRAQRAWRDQGVKPFDRPQIRKTNVACAEPMPGEEDMLHEFTASLEPRVLGQLVEVVFEKMRLAGEAGSLLKIEEEIRDSLAEAKARWHEGPRLEQGALIPGMIKPTAKQQSLFDVRGITDEAFWNEAEERVVEALREYAERAENGHGSRRRLFAEDAARGFAFIDLCRKGYDVVLMNPPFGESSRQAKGYIDGSYPRAKNDMYATFVERGLHILLSRGMLGAITSRTGFFLSSFQRWREEVVLGDARPTVFADLGYGVMDAAMVEAAAYCLEVSR